MRDTKTLLDFDNLQSTLAYYRYVIYQDMKQHYHSGRKPDEEPDASTPPAGGETTP